MDATMQERIRCVLNLEYAKRLLVQYFVQKGFADSFDAHVYPPSISNLPKDVPQFQGRVEIVPSMEEIDPATGLVRVNWNLFVLGNNRMDLGSSTHKNVAELSQSGYASSSPMPSRRAVTPRQVVQFILATLKDRKDVFMDVTAMSTPVEPVLGPSSSSSFFQKRRPV